MNRGDTYPHRVVGWLGGWGWLQGCGGGGGRVWLVEFGSEVAELREREGCWR